MANGSTSGNPYADILSTGYDPTNPYFQLNIQPTKDLNLYNTIAKNLIEQLQGPKYTNVYAASPVDMLAQSYEDQRRALLEQTTSRGMRQSGATSGGLREAQDVYGQNVLNAQARAGVAETGRTQGLETALSNLTQAETSYLGTVSKGALGEQAATTAEDLATLASNLNLAKGSAVLASIVVGGAAGAMSGAGAGGIGSAGQTGALAGSYQAAGTAGAVGYGALAGAGYANAYGGGGVNMAPYGGSPVYGYTPPGYTSSTPTYGYNVGGGAPYFTQPGN